MKGRWKFLIIIGFVLDILFTIAIAVVYEENGTQWETMIKMAHKIMEQ